MLRLYRYLKGYLRVKITGERSEKTLNLCAANRITLWDSKIIKNGIETNLFIKDFKSFRIIMRKSGLRVHILLKKGVPIKLSKNRKRLGIFLGLVMLASVLQFMSGFVWVIDVSGNEKIKTEEILSACRRIGITEGMPLRKIDAKIQRERLLLEVEGLAWASLNAEGSRITVIVSEIKDSEEKSDGPQNLKAAADGIVKEVNVSAGNCLVKPGDTVKKGQILISGAVEASGGTKFVRAAGSVKAETLRSITVEREYTKVTETETGEHRDKTVVEFFNLKIPLFLGSETREYNSKHSVKQLKLFSKTLPIKIHRKRFFYKTVKTETLSKEEIVELLKVDFKKELERLGIENYKILSEEIKSEKEKVCLTAFVSALEEITLAEQMLVEQKS